MIDFSFKRHRFPAEVIPWADWLYTKITLSYRNVEEVLAERGMGPSYETTRHWILKFGPLIAANLSRLRSGASDHWRLDETAVWINRKKRWLWRAADNEGDELDFLVQTRCNAKSARQLKNKLVKKQGFTPSWVVTDKLSSHHDAFQSLGLTVEHDRSL